MEAFCSPRLRVRNATNGEELLSLRDHSYFVPRPFDLVTRSTTIKDVFEAVCRALPWEPEFMQLLIGDKAYDFPRLLSKQKHLNTLVMSLISSSGFEGLSDVTHEIAVFYHLRMPTDFQAPDAQGYCLCNFGGCCTLCNVPSNQICRGCGNNGCCRAGNCDCDCCCDKFKDFQPQRRCPILGCRPEWAVSPASSTDESNSPAPGAGTLCEVPQLNTEQKAMPKKMPKSKLPQPTKATPKKMSKQKSRPSRAKEDAKATEPSEPHFQKGIPAGEDGGEERGR